MGAEGKMNRFREYSAKKTVVMPFFLALALYLAGPQLPRFGEEITMHPDKAGEREAAASGPNADHYSPGSIEMVPARSKKGGSHKTIWIAAALIAVAGVAAYFILTGAAKGRIDVRSSPGAAAIFIDGSDTGKVTPALLTGIKAGSRTLTLKLAGLQDYTVAVEVEKNKTTVVDAELLALAMNEDFQDNVADHWRNNGLGTWEAASGVYRFRGGAGGSGAYAYSWYDLGSYADFTLQARIRNGGDQGLAFRGNPATGEWYVLYAWGSQWAVFHISAGGFDYLVSYTYSAFLKSYPEWNVFKVMAKGANLGFYINGALVGSAYDTRLAKGKIGFQVRDYPGVTMETDDVSVSLSTTVSRPPASKQPE
jgi:hypothetical protein